ncbi:MAG: flagellar biosynthetic protein FliO [Oceanospirillaceae bacterium]|nr:flagellar biosynthetic protein FliO [Oceanospirillaceae bacterium]
MFSRISSAISLLFISLFAQYGVAADEVLSAPVTSEPGADVTRGVTPMATSDPFSTEAVLQLLLGLLFVIALIFLLAWIARRSLGVTQTGRHMRVITGLPLGAREKVVLVEVGKEQLLLGVAPGRVNLITRFDEPVVDSGEPEGAFGQRLVEALQRRSDS